MAVRVDPYSLRLFVAADPLMVVLPVGHALAGGRSLLFREALAYPLVTTTLLRSGALAYIPSKGG